MRFRILWLLCFQAITLSGQNSPGAINYDSIPPMAIGAIDTIPVQLEEVVVQAFNRRQDILRIPGALTSIRQVVIERENPVLNVLPLMQFSSGVFAQQGTTNTSRVIIRGTGARVPYATGKIRGYFSNIPLTNASGTTFLEDIDPMVLESIEIIKGPAPSIYGAGLGGTVILNPRQPAARRTGFSNSFQMGAFGLFRNASTLDIVTPAFSTSLFYSNTRSEGYRENNEFNRHSATSVTQFDAFSGTSFVALFSFSALKSFIPSSVDSITWMNNPRAAAANWLRTEGYEDGKRLLGGINASREMGNDITAMLSVFSVWHDEKELRPFDVFYEERFTIGSRFRVVKKELLNNKELEFSAGGEVFTERYQYSNYENINGEGTQGDQMTDNKEDVFTYNLFSQIDGSFGRWNISGGVNLNSSRRDYNDLFGAQDINLSGDYNYGIIVSPRIAAAYLYLPEQSIFTSLSHGFSPPSLAETLTPEGLINPDIMPEKSWNIELGFRGKMLLNKLFYDVSFYSMQITDLLVARRVGEDLWVGQNAGRSLHRGVEAELHWVMLRNTRGGLGLFNEISIRSNLTLNNFRFTDFIDLDNDYSGNTLPGVPESQFFVQLYGETVQGIYVVPSLRWIGPMEMNDANTRRTDGYAITDVNLGFRQKIRILDIDVYLKLNNLFNEKYASMILVNAPSFGGSSPRYYYPGLPFHVIMGLKLSVNSSR